MSIHSESRLCTEPPIICPLTKTTAASSVLYDRTVHSPLGTSPDGIGLGVEVAGAALVTDKGLVGVSVGQRVAVGSGVNVGVGVGVGVGGRVRVGRAVSVGEEVEVGCASIVISTAASTVASMFTVGIAVGVISVDSPWHATMDMHRQHDIRRAFFVTAFLL